MTKRITSRHSMVAALAVVVVAVMAGGMAFASNTGFKFNMPIEVLDGSGGQQGHNWMGLPYFNPYANADDFCTQVGLPALSSITTIAISGAPDQVTCGTAAAIAKILPPAEGIRIIVPVGGPASIIVVGSHNATQTVTVPQPGPGDSAAQNWVFFSVPYHTTAVNREDLCTQIGFPPITTQFLTINPDTGSPTQTACGTAASTAEVLVLGQSVRMHQEGPAIIITPAHF